MALKDQLGKMIGPLPMGAWLAIVAGGLGFAYYYRNQTAAPADPTAMDNTATDSGAGIPAGYTLDTTGTSGTSTAPADNDAWATGAVQWLAAHAYDPLVASSAVSKYLTGESLTAQEAAMIRTVIAQYGGPPSVPTTPTPKTTASKPVFTKINTTLPLGTYYTTGTANARDKYGKITGIKKNEGTPITVRAWGTINGVVYAQSVTYYYAQSILSHTSPKAAKPKPKPKPPHTTVHKPAPKPQQPKAPAKPKVRTYTVRHGDSLSKIAQRYHIRWQSIYRANTNKIKNPNLIQPGWVLVIPNS